MGSNISSTEKGEAVGAEEFALPAPPRGKKDGVCDAVGLAVSPLPLTLPNAGDGDDDVDDDDGAGADEKLPPRCTAVGAAVGESVVKVGLEEAVVLLDSPTCSGDPVGAVEGADVGANVAKSRPPRTLVAEELLVGKSTRNPVGVGVGTVLPATVLGAGEYKGAMVSPLPCPGPLSRTGLGIGTPTEIGGLVGVDG